MSYVVIARKYRPQRFEELVGQDHVSVTLKNAVLKGRQAHAYLFTGPRGVGKTSAARLLAKSLRCQDRQDDGEPCNQCDSCKSFDEGTSLDVIEIDAASNTGVDNIRELRENVGYSASLGTYRVYIIDEVHMLSTAAFNALLKTLEEPPPHVIFVFATTEIHKVPATIQSRCQRFDFKKIPAAILSENLKMICSKEGITIDESAVRTIITESEGCLRDAQSLLDQAIALCGEEIKAEALENALGLVDRSRFFELLGHIAEHNAGASLELLSQMHNQGIDPKILLGRLVYFFRDLHYYTWTKEILGDDPDLNEAIKTAREKLSEDEIVRALDLCLSTQARLSSSMNASFLLEATVAKLCLQRPALGVPAAQGARVIPAANAAALRQNSASRATPAPPEMPQLRAQQEPTPEAPAPAAQEPTTQKTAAGPLPPASMMRKLENFLSESRPAWTPVLKSLVELRMEDAKCIARVKKDFAGKRLASSDGVELLKEAFGAQHAEIAFDEGGEKKMSSREIYQQKQKEAREHEIVTEAVKTFRAVVREAKVLQTDTRKVRD